MMEAQRYPGDFDGLVGGDPAHNWTSVYAGAHLWYALATLDDPDSYIPPEKVAILGDGQHGELAHVWPQQQHDEDDEQAWQPGH